jgi:hypothetical protein
VDERGLPDFLMADKLEHFQSGDNPFTDPSFRERLNALVDAVKELQEAAGSQADEAMPAHERPFIPVRIDDYASTSGYYNFDEVEWDDSSEEWAVKTGGVTHSDMGPARAVGGSLDDGHQVHLLGRVVYITPRHAMDGSGNVVWEFTPPACESFWAEITGSASIGSNRWKYAWTEKYRGTTNFATLSGGRSGTTSAGFAINAAEGGNDGSGVEGHGVDVGGTDYPAGFSMQPIQGGRIVRMWVEYDGSGNAFYTFEATNADDGTCEAA